MRFLSSDTIKKAEMRTMENVSSMLLIENAAQAIFNELKDFKSVRVYCGKGNNGSDGYATALLLKKNGIYTEIVRVFAPESEEAIALYKEALAADIPVITDISFPTRHFDCALDAIFGIGIKGEITDVSAIKAIELINSSTFVLSADIPSGMNSDTGEICGVCVKADKTVTFTAPKLGMLSNTSVDLCGEIVISEVGIGVDYSAVPGSDCVPITKRLTQTILPERSRYSHKGTFGTAVIIAGSSTMPGACAMAASAALRSGCGLVKIIAPVSILRVLNILVKEAIVIPVPEENGVMLPTLSPEAVSAIKTADSILVGCGLGRSKEHHNLIKNILSACSCGVVIDADAINALSGNTDIIKNKNVLLTPHPKEFSRISGYTVSEIEANRISLADSFAREYGINLLLKGARSVVTYGGDNKYVSVSSSSALAKGGSGDVLAGILASLCAQGISLTDSAAAACFIHTSAGLIAEKEIGGYGTTADDLLKLIPRAIKEIQT